MVGSTGRTCQRAGVYESIDGCRERITLLENDIFPACGRCGRTVSWRLVTAN